MKPRPAARPPRSPSAPRLPVPSPPPPYVPASSSRVPPLRRLWHAYQVLVLHDAKSRLAWRIPLVCVLLVCSVCGVCGGLGLFPAAQEARYNAMFYPDSDFAYVPGAKVLVTTTAKAGSTTFWRWAHRGITGEPNADACNHTYIQDFRDACWGGTVLHPANLSRAERKRVVRGKGVLRVAITRDPFERLVSAWKSKVACDSDDFGTDVYDRDLIVPILLEQAREERRASCLSLQRFAEVMERLRLLIVSGEVEVSALNKHFRPQECHAGDIAYGMVLDVSEISNRTVLEPIARRFKYGALLGGGVPVHHASLRAMQFMSERTAANLHRFAMLTEPFPKRPGRQAA